jgi:hypothetical protein
MLKVCENKCDQCLFSKNRIVSKERMVSILRDCQKKDTHFVCHKATIAEQEVVCAGFYETQTSQMIRIAGRLNMIKFVNPENIQQ